ncbi:hypothetical protein G9Q97_06495 [Cyclobacterium sp. GBPx2]|uniref:DUF5916 domain-containing protein n=1 Tax=Cyclobacterium plantarum TaxID=2716263 RepID=A0ABX0H8B1_9BACT|nr:hypothetical protein [Cyclobacterium plantarum]
MNLTFYTDFAQVEADRQQINLTRFPLFFPELREFFLEGQDFFDMGMGSTIIPFYSRRIGLAEDRSTVPIIARARILGKEKIPPWEHCLCRQPAGTAFHPPTISY